MYRLKVFIEDLTLKGNFTMYLYSNVKSDKFFKLAHVYSGMSMRPISDEEKAFLLKTHIKDLKRHWKAFIKRRRRIK